jgi:hypothetical protein
MDNGILKKPVFGWVINGLGAVLTVRNRFFLLLASSNTQEKVIIPT